MTIRFYAIKIKPHNKIMMDDNGYPMLIPYTLDGKQMLQDFIDAIPDVKSARMLKIIKLSEV